MSKLLVAGASSAAEVQIMVQDGTLLIYVKVDDARFKPITISIAKLLSAAAESAKRVLNEWDLDGEPDREDDADAGSIAEVIDLGHEERLTMYKSPNYSGGARLDFIGFKVDNRFNDGTSTVCTVIPDWLLREQAHDDDARTG